jgi:hypothetical protein
MLHHKVVDFLGIFVQLFLLIVDMVVLPLPFHCLNKVGRILQIIRESDSWLLELTNANAASGPSNFRWFTTCSEMALRLRLKVDAALAVPVLSKIMCLRPCMGAANEGFFRVKERG